MKKLFLIPVVIICLVACKKESDSNSFEYSIYNYENSAVKLFKPNDTILLLAFKERTVVLNDIIDNYDLKGRYGASKFNLKKIGNNRYEIYKYEFSILYEMYSSGPVEFECLTSFSKLYKGSFTGLCGIGDVNYGFTNINIKVKRISDTTKVIDVRVLWREREYVRKSKFDKNGEVIIDIKKVKNYF